MKLGNNEKSHFQIRTLPNCLPAVEFVRSGKWTLDDMKKWLVWVIENDSGPIDCFTNKPKKGAVS